MFAQLCKSAGPILHTFAVVQCGLHNATLCPEEEWGQLCGFARDREIFRDWGLATIGSRPTTD